MMVLTEKKRAEERKKLLTADKKKGKIHPIK
jgi:hypothetical protein